jgi:diguanylate cyclase (GGDEF)-like protein
MRASPQFPQHSAHAACVLCNIGSLVFEEHMLNMPGLADFRAASAAIRSRFHWPMTVGITGRLTFSFVAVAILAAAANLIAEHGVAVIRTRHFDRGLATPPALPAPQAVAPAIVDVPRPPPPQSLPINSDLFVAAIERYQRAVDVHASIESANTTAEVQAAAENLTSVSKTFRGMIESRGLRSAPLSSRTKIYETAGSDYVQITDARRSALNDYTSSAEAMDRRLTASVANAWKIFGRLLARQSLMQLHTELDEIRHCFMRLSTADGDQSAAVDAIAASEAAFAATLNDNTAGLTRSEGVPWVHQMRDDFSKIVELRQTITSLDLQIRDNAARFDNARRLLAEAIPKTRPPPANPTQPSSHQAEAQPPPAAPARPSASPVLDTITTTTTGPDGHERRTVAWITAAVLAALLMISILTVRSILVPISRMLKATEKIAGGDVDVRVPGGGITELHTLSASFNRMATQLATARDMTRDYQQRLEEKVERRTRELQHLAEHDPLTHLPNRRQLFVLLNHALKRAAQNRRHVALFFLDIDNFKNLNDSMGHAFGDQVLAGIAQRLKETAQSFGFAGRLGGDEFTVVYEDAASEDVVGEAGRKLVEIFDQPLTIEGREVVVRASVGASLYPNHGHRAEDLLSAADAALFQAKALGRSQLAIFTPELLETATRKFTIEQGLRRAIEHDEFELVFQPEVSLDSLEMVLVESLVRWRLPDGRQAPPAEFLAVTEESGLIIEVGNWVLRKAIETVSRWHHGEWPEARVAINVSPRQLLDQRFVENVQNLLREFNVPPRCVELELTESVLQTGPTTIEALKRLRSHDIAIALDDFGTGYSSLASLENLPLSRIKLDRSLIASIDTNSRSAAVATALIALCKGLGLEMTAEGVERPEQFAALAEHRSIHLQGYLISRPVAAADVLQVKSMIPQIMHDLLLSAPAARTPAKGRKFERVRSMASGPANS